MISVAKNYRAALGAMPLASYFESTQGLAVHGSYKVDIDDDGESHGCLRIPNGKDINAVARFLVDGRLVIIKK